MRYALTADWVFGFRGTLEQNVRASYPQLLRSWPLLQAISFEAFELPHDYLLLVLRDRLSGVTAGPGTPSRFPHADHPLLPPRPEDIPLWQFYIRDKFSLSPGDAGVILPIRDSGRSGAPADYALFTAEEKHFWHLQFTFIFSAQQQWLESIMKSSAPTITTNYNLTGPNARVNVESTDNSTNVAFGDNVALFQRLRDLLDKSSDTPRREDLRVAIDEMERSAGTSTFTSHYTRFIALAADHVGLFSALLPALTALLAA